MVETPIPYKRTLLLDSDGDLSFDGAGKMKMTATDDEKRNQDVTMFLKTTFKEDIYNVLYGMDIMAAKEHPFSKERMEHEIRKALQQYRDRADRPNRIKSIESISIGDPNIDRVVAIQVSLIADTDTISVIGVDI